MYAVIEEIIEIEYYVEEDGKIDLLIHGRGSEDNSASLPWFTQDQIDNMPFIASSGKIMFANSRGKYTLSDIKYIPQIPGYIKGLDFNIYDLYGDRKKEIFLQFFDEPESSQRRKHKGIFIPI